jgi:hypothetical protein
VRQVVGIGSGIIGFKGCEVTSRSRTPGRSRRRADALPNRRN